MNVKIVGDLFTVNLFRIAGIDGFVVTDVDSACTSIDTLIADQEVGVILVGQHFVDIMGDTFKQYMLRRDPPLIIGIPDRNGKGDNLQKVISHLENTLGTKF